MAIVLSGTTNDITVNGVSVATDAEVSSAVASGVAPKANTADLKEIGVGQTWQDVTASRYLGATYTNSTGKPIMVFVTKTNITNGPWAFYINGVSIGHINGYGTHNSTSTIIPNGSTYMADTISGQLLKWVELR